MLNLLTVTHKKMMIRLIYAVIFDTKVSGKYLREKCAIRLLMDEED